jgi:hypothetical protein
MKKEMMGLALPEGIIWDRVVNLMIVHPDLGFANAMGQCSDPQCGKFHVEWSVEIGMRNLGGFSFIDFSKLKGNKADYLAELIFDLSRWHPEEYKRVSVHVSYVPLNGYTAFDSLPFFKPALPESLANMVRIHAYLTESGRNSSNVQ